MSSLDIRLFANGLGGTLMSYSFREPEWPTVCECKYDEARDEMDREDCHLSELVQAGCRNEKKKGCGIAEDVTASAA